mgnify:CR=1 FL=1|tara:strand:+ start:527 stop:760 length:234 start_codon:yes stop_codon:yes gene_type:complete
MKNDFKRGELVVTTGGDLYPKGSIGMVLELCPPPHGSTTFENAGMIRIVWFNYKFEDERQTSWAMVNWLERHEKENK